MKINGCMWRSIHQITSCRNSFSPESFVILKLDIRKHKTSFLQKNLIDTFCNSVLLRLTNQCLMPNYVIDYVELIELHLAKFKTIISPELLDLPPISAEYLQPLALRSSTQRDKITSHIRNVSNLRQGPNYVVMGFNLHNTYSYNLTLSVVAHKYNPSVRLISNKPIPIRTHMIRTIRI